MLSAIRLPKIMCVHETCSTPKHKPSEKCAVKHSHCIHDIMCEKMHSEVYIFHCYVLEGYS